MGSNFWDKVAENYDKNTEKVYSIANKRIIELTKKYCENDFKLLDIGCGTGMLTVELAEFVESIDAIDSSDEMLRIARENSSEKNIENIRWEKADASEIKNREEKYDIITVFNLLLYIKNPTVFLNDLRDKLPDGGYFISVTDCNGEETNFLKKFVLFLSKIGILPYVYGFKSNELSELIRNSGFEIELEENVHIVPPNYFIVARRK